MQTELADHIISHLYIFDTMINLAAFFQQLISEELIRHGSLKHLLTKSLITVTLGNGFQFLMHLDTVVKAIQFVPIPQQIL